MKTFAKIAAVSALAFSLTGVGASSAQAGGIHIRAGFGVGLAAGTILGATVASCAPAPVYYSYPAPVYPVPVYVPVVVQPAPACYYPAPVVYPYYSPSVRVGFDYGRSHHFHRR